MNLLVRCDALDLGQWVRPKSVDLAYLDPPFAVGVPFRARTKQGEKRSALGPAAGPIAFDDRWPSLEAYLAWFAPRLRVVCERLAEQGVLWLHLDHRAVHNAKLLCDQMLGARAFCGEIIWVPGNGARARTRPSMTHQTLLLYSKGGKCLWNAHDDSLREPYAKTSQAMHFTQQDEEGRVFRERTVSGKAYRYYADQGRALGSVWLDCPAMEANSPLRSETTGYPTQKPLKLLDRILRATTQEEGLVLDPFCGSGTTLEAAARLGRRFVGCDIGSLALNIAAQRLHAAHVKFALYNKGSEFVESAPHFSDAVAQDLSGHARVGEDIPAHEVCQGGLNPVECVLLGGLAQKP